VAKDFSGFSGWACCRDQGVLGRVYEDIWGSGPSVFMKTGV